MTKDFTKIRKNDAVKIEHINSRLLKLIPNTKVEKQVFNNEITDIRVADETFSIGDIIKIPIFDDNKKVNNSCFDIKYIKEDETKDFLIISEFINKTTKFFLPCLGKDIKHWKIIQFLMNAYISYTNDPFFENIVSTTNLHLKYRFYNTKEYLKFENIIVQDENYIKTIDQDGFTIYVFNVPKIYIPDIQIFKKGEYSYLSNELKERIINFYKIDSTNFLWQVLMKDDGLRKVMEEKLAVKINKSSELASMPVLEEETIQLINKL